MWLKGHTGLFSGDGNVLDLECGAGYVAPYISQNVKLYSENGNILLYVN